jgi:L-ribulose-5-phosphate 3-epimerase
MHDLGFMQGRLSPPVQGRIQAFPAEHWREEFAAGAALGFRHLEWTLDHEGLAENPLMTAAGRAEIRALTASTGVRVSSLTGDCFMQRPYWKAPREEVAPLLRILVAVIEACAELGVDHLVVPLVDGGAVRSPSEQAALLDGLAQVEPILRAGGVRLLFESDLPPDPLAAFIAGLPADRFGINYDTGNSASLGYRPSEELARYGGRIHHVHVKDRVLGGTTVPLGDGAADFPAVFAGLGALGYPGRFVLQTARAADGDHAGVLRRYRAMVTEWIREHLHPRGDA